MSWKKLNSLFVFGKYKINTRKLKNLIRADQSFAVRNIGDKLAMINWFSISIPKLKNKNTYFIIIYPDIVLL